MQEMRAIEELKERTDEGKHGKEMFARFTAKWLKNILEWIREERRKYRDHSSFIMWI
jgi:tryptophanyl-tRNA synthetase